jgi:hypothetical protein
VEGGSPSQPDPIEGLEGNEGEDRGRKRRRQHPKGGPNVSGKEHGGREQQRQKNNDMERSFWREQEGEWNVRIENKFQDIEEVDNKQGDRH